MIKPFTDKENIEYLVKQLEYHYIIKGLLKQEETLNFKYTFDGFYTVWIFHNKWPKRCLAQSSTEKELCTKIQSQLDLFYEFHIVNYKTK